MGSVLSLEGETESLKGYITS